MSRSDDRTGAGRAALRMHLAWGLLGTGAIGLGVASLLETGPTRDGRPLAVVILTALGVALVVGLGAVLSVGRLRRIVLGRMSLPRCMTAGVGLVASMLAVYTWVLVFEDFRGGLMSAALPVTACAATVAGLGGWVLASGARVGDWTLPDSRGQFAAAGTAAAVAAALTTGAGYGLPRLPIDSTTTAAVGDPVEQKGAPTEVAWTWDSGGTPIAEESLAPVPRGVAVRVEDGVVALDAKSGKELWHYRVAGTSVSFLDATPDGAWLLLGLTSGEPGFPEQLVTLNGGTGKVGFTSAAERLKAGKLIASRLGHALLSSGTLLTADASARDGGRILYGLSLADGSRRWEWHTPKGCRHQPSPGGFGDEKEAGKGTFLVSYVCSAPGADGGGERGRIVSKALDASTGRTRWTVEQPTEIADEVGGGLSSFSPDRSWVEIRSGRPANSVVVDVASGDVLHKGKGEFMGGQVQGRAGSLRRDDDGRWNLRPIDPKKPERRIPESDGFCHDVDTIMDSDAIIELCQPGSREENGPQSVAVTPLDGGKGRLIRIGSLQGDDRWRAMPALVRVPALTLVVHGDSTKLVALRPTS